jgi:hypothetical protein
MPPPLFRPHHLALAAALLCSPLLATAQGRGTIEVLPLVTSTPMTVWQMWANGINDRGQVVGDLIGGSPSSSFGFVWNPGDTQLTLLDPLATGSRAMDINNRSEVSGISSSPTTAGVVWTLSPGGTWQRQHLQLPAGASPVMANAISDNGRIAGFNLRWTNRFSVGELMPTGVSLRGINDSGTVVGQLAGQPYVNDALGEQVLGFGGGAHAVNRHGLVVGYRNAGEGFVWSRDAGVTVVPGSDTRFAVLFGVNDSDQVVGRTFNGVEYRAMLWTAAGGAVDIGRRYDPTGELRLHDATGINNLAQVVGRAVDNRTGLNLDTAYRLTLHPDWQGGSGLWDGATNWNWGGTGVAAVRVAAVHDAVIDPGRSLTVWGAADGRAKSLRVGGTFGHLVSFDVNHGTTSVEQTVFIGTGGVLRGTGLLAAGTSLEVLEGGRVQVDAGQQLQLAAPLLYNFGQLRVQGTPLQPAQLDVAGTLFNLAGAQTLVKHGRLNVSNGSVIAGQLALESGDLAVGDDTVVNGRLLVSFGRSSVSGGLINVGEVIVSNGAEASFYGALRNDGELRVSSGGAANFFGPVSGLGSFTGSGEARFEGGLTIGASPGVATINFNVTLNSTVLAEIGGSTPGVGDGHHDKIIFNGNVTLLDAPLDVVWWGGFTGVLGERYDLFDWNGGLSGSFSSLRLPTLAEGLVWDTSDLYGGGTLAIAAVPEPGTWALMLAGVTVLLMGRRCCGFAERSRNAASRVRQGRL